MKKIKGLSIIIFLILTEEAIAHLMALNIITMIQEV